MCVLYHKEACRFFGNMNSKLFENKKQSHSFFKSEPFHFTSCLLIQLDFHSSYVWATVLMRQENRIIMRAQSFSSQKGRQEAIN